MKKFTLYLLITLLAVNAVGCGSEADTSVTAATTESAQSDTEPVDTTPVSLVEAKDFEGNVKKLETEHILIATGSCTSMPPIPGADLPGVYTSDTLLERKEGVGE